MGTSSFGRASAVVPAGPGRYRAAMGPEWNCPIVPQGGLTVATIARAMQAELATPDQPLRSISTVFAQQVQAGEQLIDVQVLRRGRSMSQCSATIRNADADAGATAVAVFGANRKGFTFSDVAPPSVPMPDDCPSFRDPPPPEFPEFAGEPFPFWLNVEGRPALGHPPWETDAPKEAISGTWYRFDDPPRNDNGCWDRLAVLALADTMPGAVGQRVTREENYFPPSCDFTCHLFDDALGEWVLGINRARHAGEGYASVDMEMWDFARDQPTLVAYATQVMFFAFQ